MWYTQGPRKAQKQEITGQQRASLTIIFWFLHLFARKPGEWYLHERRVASHSPRHKNLCYKGFEEYLLGSWVHWEERWFECGFNCQYQYVQQCFPIQAMGWQLIGRGGSLHYLWGFVCYLWRKTLKRFHPCPCFNVVTTVNQCVNEYMGTSIRAYSAVQLAFLPVFSCCLGIPQFVDFHLHDGRIEQANIAFSGRDGFSIRGRGCFAGGCLQLHVFNFWWECECNDNPL